MEMHYNYNDIHILDVALDKLIHGWTWDNLTDSEKDLINDLHDNVYRDVLLADDLAEQSQDYDYGLDDDVDYDEE